ncbi:MAG: aminodeoxychorismate/anthranilate synthase component II [Eubacteriaceae bacterium]|nr:aminodeoxychorismate/anthranilate synthase component II [Eubacteriaceae bacterium]
MVVIVDNSSCFAYSLYQLVGEAEANVAVVGANEAIGCIDRLEPTHIFIPHSSVEPSIVSAEIAKRYESKAKILGIGLGCLAVCHAYGASIISAKGPTSQRAEIHIANASPIFKGLAPLIQAGFYHTKEIDRIALPEAFHVIAETASGSLMGLKHKDYPTFGLMFQPESILTPNGRQIIRNFLALGDEK